MFAIATVITRRHAEVRMTPTVCLGTTVAACVSGLLAGHYVVSAVDLGWLVAFGAINLGLGLAMFTTRARLTQPRSQPLSEPCNRCSVPFGSGWSIMKSRPGNLDRRCGGLRRTGHPFAH